MVQRRTAHRLHAASGSPEYSLEAKQISGTCSMQGNGNRHGTSGNYHLGFRNAFFAARVPRPRAPRTLCSSLNFFFA